jgi:hypothetical protein
MGAGFDAVEESTHAGVVDLMLYLARTAEEVSKQTHCGAGIPIQQGGLG